MTSAPNIVAVLLLGCALALSASAAAQTNPSPAPASTSSPSAAATPAATGSGRENGGFDISKLTSAQQEALKLAIIKTSQNPLGNITVLPFQNNFNFGVGPYARYQFNLNVQPVLPIMLSAKLNLIARTIMPVVTQPSFAAPTICASPGCPWTNGIGDFQEQLFFAPKTKPGQLIWGVGPVFQFPTASPASLGAGKWAAGPDVALLMMPGKWVLGALMTQLWSFAGPANRPNVNSFLIQPFVNYNLAGGWAIGTAPSITANWTASQNKWTVPLGGSIARTFKAGNQLMSLAVSYYTFVARPVGAPQTQFRFQWSLLWPVKRGINVQELLQEAR